MQTMEVNYLAVLVAGAAYTILGALWYSSALFGNAWLRHIGKSKEQAEADFSIWKIVGAFVGSLIAGYGIARILSWTSLEPLWGGFAVGLIGGICLVGTTVWMHVTMEGRSFKLAILNSLYSIVGFVIMGVIIGLWG